MDFFDIWHEINSVVRKNKLRTILTGITMAWGIFIFIILLGFAKGLYNAMQISFKDSAINSVWIEQGTTSMKYKGYNPGRKIKFSTEDIIHIKGLSPQIDNISGRVWPVENNLVVRYGKESGLYNIIATTPAFLSIEKYEIKEGRFINDFDIKNSRKTVVLGTDVVKRLFGTEWPINKYVNVNNVMFKVVGIYKDRENWVNNTVLIPFTAAQKIFNTHGCVEEVSLTTGNMGIKGVIDLQNKIQKYLGHKYNFDINDKKAIKISSTLEEYKRNQKIFLEISIFIWVIGIGTIIAGIMGVSNIMFIGVKERIKEIGVRKAIGATPLSIIKIILLETIIITGLFGFFGIVTGIGALETFNYFFEQASLAALNEGSSESVQVFYNPHVDLKIAISVTILLILSGILAGFFPARKAASIKPIVALRDE